MKFLKRILRWFRPEKPQDPPVDNTLRDLVKRRREEYREYIGYRGNRREARREYENPLATYYGANAASGHGDSPFSSSEYSKTSYSSSESSCGSSSSSSSDSGCGSCGSSGGD